MVWIPVLAPVGGRVVALRDVPDEVFADGLLGPGWAIDPVSPVVEPTRPVVEPARPVVEPVLQQASIGSGLERERSNRSPQSPVETTGRPASVITFAPISGRIVKLFPHAFAISRAHITVLVHLGLETVQLRGEGFHLLVGEGDEVAAGDPITEWDLAAMHAAHRDCIVPVVALGTTPNCLAQLHEPGSLVNAGDPLFDLEE